jgi:hypothetical protein
MSPLRSLSADCFNNALGNKLASSMSKQDLIIFTAILRQLNDVIGMNLIQRDFICGTDANGNTASQVEDED